MSKVDYEYRALPGGVPSADGVLSNFEEISSAMKNITSENVERGSIFTRHVSSSSKGVSWKRAWIDSNNTITASNNGTDANVTLIPMGLEVQIEQPRPILVIARFSVEQNTWDAGTTSPSDGKVQVALQQTTNAGVSWTTVATTTVHLGNGPNVAAGFATENEAAVEFFGLYESTAMIHRHRLLATSSTNYDYGSTAYIVGLAINS